MNTDFFVGCILLLLALTAAFILGTYACHVIYDIKEIGTYRWVVASFFALLFLGLGIQKIKNS